MDLATAIRNIVLNYFFLMPCLYRGIMTQTTMSPVTGYECGYEINIFDAWCGMTQEANDDYDWIRKTSDDDAFTDPQPSLDHTTGINHGHYLYAPIGSQTIDTIGQLNMPDFAQNPNPQCLEFFYQIGGDDAGLLNVYQWLSASSMPSSPAWQMTGDTADIWNRGLLTIDPQSGVYTVSFVAVVGNASKGFIAIDDVKLSDGVCPYVNFSCTFEVGMCDIVQDTTDDEDWFRLQGSTGSTFTGPSIDHTLGTPDGWYIYIEASYMSIGELARVETPTMQGVADGSAQACLTFFYHMFGAGVGELKVYVLPLGANREETDPSWVLSGNRGDKWRGAEVDITLPDDFTIVFEAVRGETYEGDLALDDIDFRRGDECPGQHKPSPGDQQGTCDFEEVELCEYQQDQTDDADWIWQNRASPYTNAGPLYDHTNNDEFGFYLFLYGDVGHRLTARMISPIVPLQGSHTCLEFWWHLYGNDDQKLSVYCVKDGEDIPETPLLSMSGDYGDYWRRSRHEIPPELTPCRLIFEATTGIHNRDDIAIDDVAVYQSEQCPQDPYFINPTTTPPTTSNVNCDFENTNNQMCGWTQSIRDGFDWILYHGPTQDYNSGPDVDHTTQTEEGFYMLVDSYEAIPTNTRAEMISPLISPSSSTRCFQFWYYMNGYYTNFLNIFILPYGQTLPIDPNVQIFGNRGSQWIQGLLSVPSSTRSFYIVVEGSVGEYSYNADIAVDDFTMTNGMCQDQGESRLPTVANCDFEEDMCGYTQVLGDYTYDNSDDFDWFWNSGSTGTDGSGPMNDHTKGTAAGHYLYMEASQPRKPGDQAVIVSPIINKFNDTYCMEFFYHMSGDDTASLVVTQRGDYYPEQELARLTGPAGTGWKPFNVDVGIKYGPIEVVFTGVVGNSYRGDIGLDDITLTPGPCGGYPLQSLCNFEYGYGHCMFTQRTDDQLDWVWFDALVGETPPIDWPGFGSYIYVNGSNRTSGDTAIIQTQMMSSVNNDHCFNFLYALDDGMSLDFVRVDSDGVQETLKSITKSTGMKMAEFELKASDHPNVNYQVQIIATVGDGKNGLAVIDDTMLTTGVCGTFNGGMSTSNSTTTVAIVLGILLGVAILVLVAMGVLHHRQQTSKSQTFPAAVSYKNGTTINNPDLTKDPGIDNPNYITAGFSSA